MLNIFVNWLKKSIGDFSNPIALKPLLSELWIVYIVIAIVGAIIYHFTNNRNLNSSRQNWYFIIVFLGCLVVAWIYSGVRLYGSLGEQVNFGNLIGLCLKATVLQILIWYVAAYYFFRISFFMSKKRYMPSLLTSFLKPKR